MPPPPISSETLAATGVVRTDSATLYPGLHAPGEAGLPALVVENALGRAALALQGAHLLSFAAAGGRELLWLSPRAVFAPGKAIRGGIPLCLPWFGPGPKGGAAHGFARTAEWTLIDVKTRAGGATRLALELTGEATTDAHWPHAFAFRLDVEVGSELTLGLCVENRGPHAAPLSFAFHAYFAVGDVRQVRVNGLDGSTCIDKLADGTRSRQHGELPIHGALDRIYLDAPERQTLRSPAAGIDVDSDTRCAIVWNVGENDRNMPDIGAGNHAAYLCLERGEVADFALTLPPGGAHRAFMRLAGLK